jgi:hypothetical protein
VVLSVGGSTRKGCKLKHATLSPELATFLNQGLRYPSSQLPVPTVRDGQLGLRYPESAVGLSLQPSTMNVTRGWDRRASSLTPAYLFFLKED